MRRERDASSVSPRNTVYGVRGDVPSALRSYGARFSCIVLSVGEMLIMRGAAVSA